MKLPSPTKTVLIKTKPDDHGDDVYTFAGFHDGDKWYALFPDCHCGGGGALQELHLPVDSWEYI